MPFAALNTLWFALIGLLWAGFLFLEGFDFGVGMVTPIVIADETDRRLCLNAVGPVWDGNEVWLLVAGGATFAAFPLWYARLFSGFYLALFLLLLALIVRGVSFEFRGQIDRPAWRRAFDLANFVGSAVPALILGVFFTDLVHGVPLAPGGHYLGGLLGLLHPIALLGGLAAVAVFALHGSLFLALKTAGPVAERAAGLATRVGAVAAVLVGGTTAWVAAAGRPTIADSLNGLAPLLMAMVATALLLFSTAAAGRMREGVAFVATGAAILLLVGAIFARMFPAVLPASNRAANALTIGGASSHHYTLVVMTVVAACFTPIVLIYQGWTYWVFRQRLVRPPGSPPPPPSTAWRSRAA